ncbi:MAG: hypothetical protein JSU94_16610 [Phycisphaerales bacterium]|nr:MAG: hypothetical protein JSU94_16610 [Phycisphaerales bacterium]
MKLDIARIDVWVAGIDDRPGGLAEKLRSLADAGANLEFLIARRAPDQPGRAVVFAAPIQGAKEARAAKEAGFEKTKSLGAIRVSATDKPGLGLALTEAIAQAGLNLRGLSGVAVGKKAVFYIALDTAADVAKAVKRLKGI